MGGELTVAKLLAMRDQLDPPIYYATFDGVTPGKVLRYNGSDDWPPYLIVHPDDLDTLKAQAPDRRWVHIRNYRRPRRDPWEAR